MENLLLIFAITAILLLLSFCFIGIKMFLKKGGEFKKQCSSVDPLTGERIGCSCGKKSVYDECKSPKRYSPLEINKELLEETK
ncbi:MAG: hypothetical protein PHG98_07040 [Bacteroidales bacterium]|jgi:hypothetical protein|uniref:Membrane or secreted protein n=1 Tax=bioreactor metagenome TaxID=1076179 RepID=A0A644TT18_9ZZZZ|nr:membrane or secreted protein [Bacilli bacterium]MCK9321218.1 hypothetical protein [Bacteroidales bacterium]MEA4968706.1 hypothetical protein [Bacteroidaceae bacterium]MDD3286674.1 hypothetical protein [Bacteroidales bacterium]MDD3667447.1 hypothetical protein [Bacteroidales bacterium]